MGLQKKGAAELPKINEQTFWQNLKNFFTSKTWIIGFLMVQIQWAFLTLALDFAPISIITPLMSVGMVALVIFSYFYLKEPISKVEIMGIIAIIIGIVILGITNPQEETLVTFDNTCVLFGRVEAIVFLSIIFVTSIGLIIACVFRQYKNADILFGISAGITDALGAILLKAYMAGADFRNWGIINESVGKWEWWMFFTFMIIFNGTATIYLQVAYQRGRAVIVAPIFAVFAMIMPVFAGVIIFDDWNALILEGTSWKIYLKIVALVIIIVGAVILSIHSARVQNKLEQRTDSEIEDENEEELEILETHEATTTMK